MLARLRSFFRRPAVADTARLGAEHWDRWQEAERGGPLSDWADHPVIQRCILDDVLGCPGGDLIAFLRRELPGLSQADVLSLCCGDGGFEEVLARSGAAGHVTGFDLAPGRIAVARARAADELSSRLSFEVVDVNQGDYGVGRFDAVLAKAALHHIDKLEDVFAGIRRCLRPGGALVALDYFGPSRFQWPDRQVAEADRFLEERVPLELRTLADGQIYAAHRPTVDELIALDPTEAVRSGEIMAVLRRTFSQVRVWEVGGSLLHLVFGTAIVNRFDADNSAHAAIVREAFSRERRLMAEGAIGADFKLVIAHD